MKTIQVIENAEELQNVLVQEDVVLHLDLVGFSFQLKSFNDSFSDDLLIPFDVMKMICNILSEQGIVVTFKIG